MHKPTHSEKRLLIAGKATPSPMPMAARQTIRGTSVSAREAAVGVRQVNTDHTITPAVSTCGSDRQAVGGLHIGVDVGPHDAC